MFDHPHHQRIAHVLEALDADLLARHGCWFGGGTAITLTHGEYRESVDIDFLVSDPSGYRALRNIVREQGLAGLASGRLDTARPPRSDRYGIRARVLVDDVSIKFEIVHEGRITFDAPPPAHQVCGIQVLAPADQVASKLLANDDRWADRSTFSRDLIDLAMLRPSRNDLGAGQVKATAAYGTSVQESLAKAVAQLRERPQRLRECMRALGMEIPRATVWSHIERIAQAIEETTP